MNPVLLSMIPVDMQKWKNCIYTINVGYSELTSVEQSCFDYLRDHWKSSFDENETREMLDEYSKDTDKHRSNRQLHNSLKEFKQLCVKYYLDDADTFSAFAKAQKNESRPTPPLPVQPQIPVSAQPSAQVPLPVQPQQSQQPQQPVRSERLLRADFFTHDGRHYMGEALNGVPQGRGTVIFTDGSRYEGEFNNGLIEGMGVLYRAGRVWRGHFVNERPAGRGRISYPDGANYEGEWNVMGANGQGLMIYPDRSRYNGMFVDDVRHGAGVFTSPQGERRNVRYINGVLEGQQQPVVRNQNLRSVPVQPRTSDYSSSASAAHISEGSLGNKLVKLLFLLILVAGAFCLYQFWYKNYLADSQARPMRTFVNKLMMRSACIESDTTQITMLPYGASVLVYSADSGWASIKYDGMKGFIESKHLVEEDRFERLNSAFADERARRLVSLERCRRAVLEYVSRQSLSADWKLSVPDTLYNYNPVLQTVLKNEYTAYSSFAFLLTNQKTGEQKAAVYSFRVDESPVFCYDEDVPANNTLKNVRYFPKNKVRKYRIYYTPLKLLR